MLNKALETNQIELGPGFSFDVLDKGGLNFGKFSWDTNIMIHELHLEGSILEKFCYSITGTS